MSDAGHSMLGAGAWGWPTEMLWGGRWEGGSCLGMPVRIKDFKIKKKRRSAIHFSCSVMSDSLKLHGLEHSRLPCPSPTPGVYPNSCPLSRWCHPNHLILCHPLLLLPSIFPSIRVFSNESALRIRWPKYWSSSFNISPSSEHPGLISFRRDWLDLLAVQRVLKSLLQ